MFPASRSSLTRPSETHTEDLSACYVPQFESLSSQPGIAGREKYKEQKMEKEGGARNVATDLYANVALPYLSCTPIPRCNPSWANINLLYLHFVHGLVSQMIMPPYRSEHLSMRCFKSQSQT